MRILSAALLCFVIASSAYSATVERIMFGSGGLPDYALVLLLLSTYLMLEGIYAIEQERKRRQAAERDRAREQLRSAERREQRPDAAVEDIGRLKTSLRNAEQLIKELEKRAAAGGDGADPEAQVINFLGMLQEQGRLVDFLMDDIAGYDDSQVGAAARVVHQGCREVLNQCFNIRPVIEGEEGQQTELEPEQNSRRFRILGTVSSAGGRKTGTVMHRGWQTTKVGLPKPAADAVQHDQAALIIAPAQVEVS